MGGCASKPKGLKAEMEGAAAPEPVPEVVKEETSTISASKIDDGETKEIGEVKKTEVNVEEDGDVDEKGNKRRSLNSLLNETEEGKDSIEYEKPTETVTVPSEPIKKVEDPKTEKTASESSSTDVIKPAPIVAPLEKVETEKKPVESAPAVVAPPEKVVESEKKPVESAPAVETVKPVKVEEKKTEEKVDAKKDIDVKATVEKASEVVIKKEESSLPVASATEVKGVVAQAK